MDLLSRRVVIGKPCPRREIQIAVVVLNLRRGSRRQPLRTHDAINAPTALDRSLLDVVQHLVPFRRDGFGVAGTSEGRCCVRLVAR